MDENRLNQLLSAIENFIIRLDSYGEKSYDHQSFFAGPIGGRAKTLYYRKPLIGIFTVAPMIFFEAFLPGARRLFWKPQRFPIADAHFSMGFSYLSRAINNNKLYDKAVHFLNVLVKTRCPDYKNFCWGYPFDWVTRNGTISANTPLITTTPYCYEAFALAYEIDQNVKWLEIMKSIVEHALTDIKDYKISPNSTTSAYSPIDTTAGVINASAYRAFLLAAASVFFNEGKYWKIAERNLNFVLQSQQPNGSWFYAIDDIRDFVDHFHTCFVLKALAKIEKLTGHKGCHDAIDRGLDYYLQELFDDKGLPKPFSKPPRLTVYRNELYDYAEFINLAVLLRGRFEQLDKMLLEVLDNLLTEWLKPDGLFRSRKLHFGWDNVPMHRWAQSQLFRSLSFLYFTEKSN